MVVVVAGMQYAHTSSRLNYPALSIGRTCELGADTRDTCTNGGDTLPASNLYYLSTDGQKQMQINLSPRQLQWHGLFTDIVLY